MDRNFKISLVSNTGASIKQVSDFRTLFKFITTDEGMIKKGELLAELHETSKPDYDKMKGAQPGFIIGEFSYRNVDSCVHYEPVLGFDIDHVAKSDHEQLMNKLQKWPFTFVAMPSVSKSGIRVLVYSASTKDRHGEYYSFAAKQIAALLGIPTKSKIKESFKAMGYNRDQIGKFLNENTHIDDATKDISRFWYYSGLRKEEIFVNKDSAILTYKEEIKREAYESKGKNTGDYAYTFTERDKVEYLVNQIESNRIDITQGVQDWFKIGLGLYDEFGYNGEDYFLRVSAFHPDADKAATEREWKRVVSKYRPGTVSIGSFYKWCKDYGVGVDFNELIEIHSDKFEKKKKEQKKAKANQVKKIGLFEEDLEAEVISTCIYSPSFIDTIYDLCPRFSASVFFDPDATTIFEIIQKLRAENYDVTPLSIRSKLRYEKLKPEAAFEKFTTDRSNPANFNTNVKLVYDLHLKRKVEALGQKIIQDVKSKDLDVFEYADQVSSTVSNITDYGNSETEKDALAVSMEVLNQYEQIKEAREKHGQALIGVPTGLNAEDQHTNGYRPGNLIIVAARPGMGKTSKVLKTALVNAQQGIPGGFFSLEMPSVQLGQRMISIASKSRLKKITDATLVGDEQESFFNATSDFSNLPIQIDDKSGITIEYIERKARKWKQKFDIQYLIIDYLQLMSFVNPNQNRTNGVGEITRRLKTLAKELGIPIIALSQLSRAVEVRGGSKRPQLSDLRDSGNIEEDADMVVFLYRPEYYQILEDEEGQSLKGVAEIIYAKNRHGSNETLKVLFDAEYTDFLDSVDYSPFKVDTTPAPLLEEVSTGAIMRPMKRNDDEDVPF